MQNPFRSEAEAFRFVLLLVGYFAAIVLAKVILGTLAAFLVFVLLTAIGLYYALRTGRQEAAPPQAPARLGAEDERRILVIANETVGGEALRECIREKSEGYRESVLVVTPALNSPLRHWASDDDNARAAASERLERSIARLRDLGVEASGEVGDSEPLQALEDYARIFGPDEIIISTHPEGRSHWLERGVVDHARERFTVPITHVVVDLEAEREEVR
jgi:nucleotide-binding universal stress UspA family protein